jgi:hypothetical protein
MNNEVQFPNQSSNSNPNPNSNQAPSAEQQYQKLLKMREMLLIMKTQIATFAEDEVFKDLEIIAMPTDVINPVTQEPVMKSCLPADALKLLDEKLVQNAKEIDVAKSGLIIVK